MNQHSSSLITLPTRARGGFISLFGAVLLVCLPANAYQIEAQLTAWTGTGSLGTARSQHTSTLLENGKVLVAGGSVVGPNNLGQASSSVELYDPATGVWSATGSLSTPRTGHIAVQLPNGKVLVAGGFMVTSAELYDPNTGTWSTTGELSVSRQRAAAVLLHNGKVLVVGGFQTSSRNNAELYDSITGQWSFAGTLNAPRALSTATLLSDGRVLVAGGCCSRSAELYDPATGGWILTGEPITAREQHAATLLANGKVLVSGGGNTSSTTNLAQAELYDPATGQWSATSNMTTGRIDHTLTLIANGKALAVGGYPAANSGPLESAELYDPATGSWTATPDLNVARGFHQATLLPNGKVLVAGGFGPLNIADAFISASELFDGTAALPRITGASISGKKLLVQGQNFDDGAKLLLNDEKQKSVNDELSPTTLLVCKKAGKFIGGGETVRLKVRNSDGTESAEFAFTRPAE
jgi:WD40 repeat protein